MEWAQGKGGAMGKTSWLLQGLKALVRTLVGLMAKSTEVPPPEVEKRLADAIPEAGLTVREERVLALRHGIQAEPTMELESKWGRDDEHPFHTNARLAIMEDMLRQQYERRERQYGNLHRSTAEQRHRPRSGSRKHTRG